MAKATTISSADAAAQRVLDCRAVIAKIEAQLSALGERRERIAVERRDLAFAATAGETEAKSQIERLRSEAVAISAEIEDVEIAVSTAKARLREALAAQARVADIERAKKIRAHAAVLHRAGQDTDDAARQLAKAFTSVHTALQALAGLGIVHPGADLARVNLVRALNAALQGLPLRLDVIAPGDRHTFESITGGWGKSAERSASILENGNQSAEAA
jgi:hypothetical protein